MSNTVIRRWATRQQINAIKAMLRGFYMEGEEAADLIDELHASLHDSSWKRIGSGDLEAFADTMRAECEAFAEQEIEQHHKEMAA